MGVSTHDFSCKVDFTLNYTRKGHNDMNEYEKDQIRYEIRTFMKNLTVFKLMKYAFLTLIFVELRVITFTFIAPTIAMSAIIRLLDEKDNIRKFKYTVIAILFTVLFLIQLAWWKNFVR